jgi:hypothetical protein
MCLVPPLLTVAIHTRKRAASGSGALPPGNQLFVPAACGAARTPQPVRTCPASARNRTPIPSCPSRSLVAIPTAFIQDQVNLTSCVWPYINGSSHWLIDFESQFALFYRRQTIGAAGGGPCGQLPFCDKGVTAAQRWPQGSLPSGNDMSAEKLFQSACERDGGP